MAEYLYDPEELHEIARSAIGHPLAVTIELIAAEVETRYPGSIVPTRAWVFSNAGGSMGQLTVLHASLREYLIVFGTPIGTEGHTGRFWAEDHFMILEGEQWAYGEGELDRRVYRAGDRHVLPRGVARGWSMPDHCYALEYARGNIPSMLPFGLADALTSTLDVSSVARTLSMYTRATLRAWRGARARGAEWRPAKRPASAGSASAFAHRPLIGSAASSR